MNPRRPIAASALITAFCCRAAAANDDIKTWTEPETGGAPTYCAEGVIDAPPAQVWALVSRCADYVKNMPSISASKELSREGDERTKFTTVCEVAADVPFPFPDLVSVSRATLTVDADGGYTRAWTLIRGDYEVNDGSWRLVPVDGGAKTKVTYRIHVKPKLALPDSMIRSTQETRLPQVIQYLRDRTAKP
ncbi:MAG TPA: SRPBCC family protein [Myxococcota bacterium]|nr:SRPBCC family protein [Myxococcota bacterium]